MDLTRLTVLEYNLITVPFRLSLSIDKEWETQLVSLVNCHTIGDNIEHSETFSE